MDAKQFEVRFAGQTYPAYYVKDELHDYFRAKDAIAACADLIGIDIETQALPEYRIIPTAALSPHTSRIRLLQFFTRQAVFVLDMNYVNKWKLFSWFAGKRFVAHDALFETKFLLNEGYPIPDFGCSMLIYKIVSHATMAVDRKASLQAAVKSILKIELFKEQQTSDWSVEDLTFEQVRYAAMDAVATVHLAKALAPMLAVYKLVNYYTLCKAVQKPIAEMELAGLGFDIEQHKGFVRDTSKRLLAAKEKALAATGMPDITPNHIKAYLNANLTPDELAVWPRTPKGMLATDSDSILEYGSEKLGALADYFTAWKLVISWGTEYALGLNAHTKRFHSSYFICGARTGRLSNCDPNIQQIPRDSKVRGLFVPPPGWVFLSADYSQIELRVAAELSRDAAMLAVYAAGGDLHALTAANLLGKKQTEITSEDRRLAKAINFGFLYGLGANGFKRYAKNSYGVEVSIDDGQKAISVFRRTYPQYYAWQMNQARRGEETCYVRTPMGKLRKLEHDNTYGTSMNTPIQGGAAECMMNALIRFSAAVASAKVQARLVACVHDEMLVECVQDEIPVAKAAIENSMVRGFQDVFPSGITVGLVEVKQGASWGACKG